MAYRNGKDIVFDIDDADFQKLAKKIKNIADGRLQRREVIKILRRQMKDVERGVREFTPVRGADNKDRQFSFRSGENKGSPITSQANFGMKGNMGPRSSMATKKKIFPRGNLKRSIGIMTNRDRKSVGVRVAPRKGRRRRVDGFYGWWHVYGWHPFGSKNKIPANDFIWDGAKAKLPSTSTEMTAQLRKYIEKQLR